MAAKGCNRILFYDVIRYTFDILLNFGRDKSLRLTLLPAKLAATNTKESFSSAYAD